MYNKVIAHSGNEHFPDQRGSKSFLFFPESTYLLSPLIHFSFPVSHSFKSMGENDSFVHSFFVLSENGGS